MGGRGEKKREGKKNKPKERMGENKRRKGYQGIKERNGRRLRKRRKKEE